MRVKLLPIIAVFILILTLVSCFLVSRSFFQKPLVANKLKADLKFTSIISHGNRNKPEIALTFDADMTPFMLEELNSGKIKSFYNEKIVDVLKKENIPATIFMSGMWVEKYPEIVKMLSQNPLFEIANHSYSHPGFTNNCFSLPKVPKWDKDGEFQKSQDIIEKITGVRPKLFRFPGGCHDETDVKLANQYGLTVVDWDAASGDSFNTSLSSIIKTSETNTQNGSILLFHFHGSNNAPYSAEALKEVIPYLKEKGYKFVKVSDLLAGLNQ